MTRDQLLLNEICAQRDNANNVAANLGADLMLARNALDGAQAEIKKLKARISELEPKE